MNGRLLFVFGLCLTLLCVIHAAPAEAACAAAWSCGTSYNTGAVVSYGGNNYTMLYSRAANCPGYAPNVDNWWRNDGACSGTGGTATPTARAGSTPRPTATPRSGVRATATARPRATATASGTCNYPNWVAGQYYNVGAIVRYAPNGQYYRATNANPGYDPTVSTWYWSPYSCSGGGATATPTRTATPSGGVSKPGEVPSDQWSYMVSATNTLRRSADYAWLLAAVCKKESAFGAGLGGSPSGGDGLMQVEPNTRSAYSSQFSATFGRSYNHGSYADQIALGALILHDKINRFGGSYYEGLLRYNGGDNWYPGATDSYGRVIDAPGYASSVMSTYRGYGGTHN